MSAPRMVKELQSANQRATALVTELEVGYSVTLRDDVSGRTAPFVHRFETLAEALDDASKLAATVELRAKTDRGALRQIDE